MKSTLRKYSRVTRSFDIPPCNVQSGLAVTPSEMLRASESGIPISSQLLSESSASYDNAGPEVQPLMCRGIEAVDVFEYQSNSRKKIKNYVDSVSSTLPKSGE